MDFLEKLHITDSYLGLFHTVTAVLAMLFGTAVFLNKKGTRLHKQLGRIYGVNMLLLNLSAFTLYNFGGFSLFHAFALVSLATLTLGMWPVLTRRKKGWQVRHYYFMSWSVVGLYCAFWSELGVRLFDVHYFWWVVMSASVATAAVGGFVINRQAKRLKFR